MSEGLWAIERKAMFKHFNDVDSLRAINAELLKALKLALFAFETNSAIDWNIIRQAIDKAEK